MCKTMKARDKLLTFVLLLAAACGKPEDVLPVPHRYEKTNPPATPEQFEKEVKQRVPTDAEGFQHGNFKGIPYRILFPRNYDSTTTYPLHLFLHGIGERGSDNERQLSVGSSYFQLDSIRNAYPAFIVFPQCSQSEYWFNSDVMGRLKDLIDTLLVAYNINKDHISIGGFSMGAYGTFAMVARYPDLFETTVAISGDGDPGKATRMAKPAWQIFAGKRDHVVPSSRTEKMAIALEKAGASVSYTLYPLADHRTIWTKAFSEPDFFSRLFPREAPR